MKRNEVRGGAEVSKVKCGERIDVCGVYGGKMIELAGSTWSSNCLDVVYSFYGRRRLPWLLSLLGVLFRGGSDRVQGDGSVF